MEEEQRKDFAYVGVNVAVEKSLRSRLVIIFTVKKVMAIFISFIIKDSNIVALSSSAWKWSAWSSCTKSCGGGTKERSRLCGGQPCSGEKPQIKTCNNIRCKDGEGNFFNIYNKKSIMILKLSNETSFKTSFRRRSPRTRRVGQLVGMEFLL